MHTKLKYYGQILLHPEQKSNYEYKLFYINIQ
jgi:hypothetical protein